jgi:hypothetical protein
MPPVARTCAFGVGPADARVTAAVTIATLRFSDRGVIRASAQAIVRG